MPLASSAPATYVSIPNGVDIPAEVGGPADPPHVLFVGRLSEEKGILEFTGGHAKGCRASIVGDGPLRKQVPEAVGFVPRRRSRGVLRAGGGRVRPSRREGYGVVAREAMAFGRPVIASNVGGLLDVVTDGKTGRLVPPVDAPALRTAVTTLLQDRELRERMGEAARGFARDALAWGKLSAELEIVLRAAGGLPQRLTGEQHVCGPR